jgi:hypothetical protein
MMDLFACPVETVVMPSPFPGMDPYLEDPRLWPGVHHRLISVIAEQLSRRLRPAYFVEVEERVYLRDDDDPRPQFFVPDAHVVETGWGGSPQGDAAAVIDQPLVLSLPGPAEIREAYLEVQDARSRDVITVIEVLSPSNKLPGSNGFESYCQKRDAILQTRTGFVEIDLLRGGGRMPWLKGLLPTLDYVAHASTHPGRPIGKVWPMRLEQRLKTIGIPLKEGEPEAPLPLQNVIETVYDRAGYDLILDYTVEPEPPLTFQQQVWAYQFLKDRVQPPAQPRE